MKWFDNWFRKKCKQALGHDEELALETVSYASTQHSLSSRMGGSSGTDSLNFQIYFADGGYVLEYSHYDRKADEYVRRLHLVRSDENLGDDIAKVITVEMLRR